MLSRTHSRIFNPHGHVARLPSPPCLTPGWLLANPRKSDIKWPWHCFSVSFLKRMEVVLLRFRPGFCSKILGSPSKS